MRSKLKNFHRIQCFDVETLCWFVNTSLADSKTGRVSLDLVAAFFLNRRIESPRDECLIIAKLYKKLTADSEDAISTEEIDFLFRYEFPHILHLEDMRKVGFPCDLKAIDKTKKSLFTLQRNIIKRLAKKAIDLNLETLDVATNHDQKVLINRILCNKGKEPISKLTIDQLEKYPEIPDACMALDFRRIYKAIGDLENIESVVENGRIHPNINYFNLTGRITMELLQMVLNPFNLKSKPGKEIALRNIFRASGRDENSRFMSHRFHIFHLNKRRIYFCGWRLFSTRIANHCWHVKGSKTYRSLQKR